MQKIFYKNNKSLLKLLLVLTLISYILFYSPQKNIISGESSNVYFPKTSAGEITIITPENKTYTEPMSGYYPATYGFENDIISAPPQGLSSEAGSGTIIEVIDQLDGHNMITRLYDGASGTNNYANLSHTFSPKSTGVIEFWFRRSGVPEVVFIELWNETLYCLSIYSEDRGSGLAFEYYNGTDYIAIMSHNSDQWYHHRLDFNCTSGTFDWYIDGVLRGDDLLLRDPTPFFVRFTVRTRGWGSTGYNAYIDGLGMSWDINYNVGDNVNEGLLLSYENSTTLDWQGYSLDGQSNQTILGNKSIPIPSDGVHSIQVFGNDSIGTIYESNINHFSVYHIEINTPENITYAEPMAGYYPGTYSFDNDEDNDNPENWVDLSGTNCDVQIIAEKSEYKKILEMSDNSATDIAQITQTFNNAQMTGEIEWWWSSDDVTKLSRFQVYASDDTQAIVIQMDSDKFQYYDSPTPTDILGVTPLDGIWHHLKLIFNCSSDTFDLYIDGTLRLNDVNFRNIVNDCKWLRFQTSNSDSSYYQYLDAIGYSWDSNYNIGDNLNEGLLLSYSNSTNLDWVGYSLDNQVNKTILGNTTIPMPSDGLHNIQVFGNDSLGTNYNSDMRYFSVDTLSPIITINSPLQNENFGSTAPNFDLSITEPNLNTTWYTLDSGLTNFTFTGFTGTINQTEWGDQVDGSIIIRFYANDTFGRINYEEVIVEKDTIIPSIIINSPLQNEYFASTAPNFDLSITEPNLNTTWYTLDSGLTNFTFTGFTGTINQTEWDDQVDGSIIIRFYINDTVGHVNYAEVLVEKDTTIPSIIINSPNADDYYGSAAPNFNVSITESNLDTAWYTLDDGIINITFTGFTGTINQTEWDKKTDGQVTIRFYANDTFGHLDYTDVLINKDTLDPVITINSPLVGEIFTDLPPEFNLTIDEVNLEASWYTIDDGITNITFTGLTGYIDSTAWNDASIGAVTIRFYARDKVGNEVYQEIIVVKSSSQQGSPPGIPGFNIALLCLTIVIITASSLKIKKYKFK